MARARTLRLVLPWLWSDAALLRIMVAQSLVLIGILVGVNVASPSREPICPVVVGP